MLASSLLRVSYQLIAMLCVSTFLVVVSLVSVVGGDPTCFPDESTGLPQCVCMFNNGSKIDLRNIKERFAVNK